MRHLKTALIILAIAHRLLIVVENLLRHREHEKQRQRSQEPVQPPSQPADERTLH